MTAEEYRQRMIQAFHNQHCDELIALVVLPTEKEFEHLEWLLEKHYKAKPEPSADCVSRQAVIEVLNKMDRYVANELTLCDTERKFPQNEVFIVDDVYEEIVEQLPSIKLRQVSDMTNGEILKIIYVE